MAGTLLKAFVFDQPIQISAVPMFQVAAKVVCLRLTSIRLSFSDLTVGPREIGIVIGASEGTAGLSVTPQKVNPDVQSTIQAKFWTNNASPFDFGSPAIAGGNDITRYRLGPGGMLELLEKDFILGAGETFTIEVGGESSATDFVSVEVEAEE
jgi:hypothetical protein